MDMKYLEFAAADRFFYDRLRPGQAGPGRARSLRVATSRDWSSWRTERSGGWTHYAPVDPALPEQGWKIHVSATPENAQRLLTLVSEYCRDHEVPFKHLPTTGDLLRQNMKYASRGGSGKFVTVYPRQDAECERVVHDLDALVGGMDGPYVLSDVRFRAGPLYLRYGGFRLMTVRTDMDELVPAIRTPEGDLVPDPREPRFTPPSWVELPAFVRDCVERLEAAGKPERFVYAVDEALHFSNGGGVYRGTADADGRPVIIKEGRPHAGLAPDGADAVARLRREADWLRLLADDPDVVDVVDDFTAFDHLFVVEELVEGNTLNSEMVRRTPTIQADSTAADRAEYRAWALDAVAKVEAALDRFHARGVVYGDLHPNNIVVRPDGRVCFIDFEMAYRVDEEDVTPAGAPGYVAPDGRTGIPADDYALGALQLSLFLPLVTLLPLDHGTLPALVARAREDFDLPDEYCAAIRRRLAPVAEEDRSVLVREVRGRTERWDTTTAAGIAALVADVRAGIRESADFARADRVYPGDIVQLTDHACGVAHGIAGNLLTDPGDPEHVVRGLRWLRDAAEAASIRSAGFYDGWAGIVHTFRVLGDDASADELLDRLLEVPVEQAPSDWFSGLAGLGIFLMDEVDRAPRGDLGDLVARIAAELRRRTEAGRPAHLVERRGRVISAVGRGGLVRGAAGQALFWTRHHEHTGDPASLDLAQRCVDADLEACMVCADGSLQLSEGWRTLPYLASGSAGVGLAMLAVLRHRHVPRYVEALPLIERALTPDFCIQPNLFNGRAGLAQYLLRLGSTPYASPGTLDLAARHVRALGMYAVVHGTGIHFPGEQLIRLSTDWATGSAGVLATLDHAARVLHGAERPRTGVPLLGLDRCYAAAPTTTSEPTERRRDELHPAAAR